MKKLFVLFAAGCLSMSFVTGEFWTAANRTLTSNHVITCNYDRALLTVYNTGTGTMSIDARGTNFPLAASSTLSFDPESFYLGEGITLNVTTAGSCITVYTRRSPY